MPYEFDALDRLALSQDEVLRRQRMRDEGAVLQAREDEAAAKRKAIATARTLDNNRRQLLAEYHLAGVEPPNVDAAGRPTVSLSMLLKMGWSIQEAAGERVLVQPERRRRKTREEYAAERDA